MVYSLLLYDTDLDEEVWSEEVAHHAVIYELRWSKNDRYLLSCAADGTAKVWDLIALHPLMSLYPSNPPSNANPIGNTPGDASVTGIEHALFMLLCCYVTFHVVHMNAYSILLFMPNGLNVGFSLSSE